MIRHLFRLVWNRRKRHFLLMTEVFFSFIVLFYVGTQVITKGREYLRPLGFDHENEWVLQTGYQSAGLGVPKEETRARLAQIEIELQSHPEIENFSWGFGCLPYMNAVWMTRFGEEGNEVSADVASGDDRFAQTMNLNVIKGRWFSAEDDASSTKPIVINADFKRQYIGDGQAVGHIFANDKGDYKVVGVIDNFRYRGDFEDHRALFFRRLQVKDTAEQIPDQAIVRVKPGTDARFEESLLKRLSSIAPGWSLQIETLSAKRTSYIKDMLLGLLTLGTVAGFLVFNVALGLFGVLWYSINRRKSEFGLRRALGSGKALISWHVLGEALALATFAIIIGLIVAVQMPVLGLDPSIALDTYVMAMATAAIAVYLLVFLCALYPSRLAMRIQPARALHDE